MGCCRLGRHRSAAGHDELRSDSLVEFGLRSTARCRRGRSVRKVGLGRTLGITMQRTTLREPHMPINRHCLLIFALSAALLTAASADPLIDKSWPSNVGPTRLSLPIPDGYEEATQVAPALRQFGERLAPPVNRVLAYFVSTDDVRALRASANGAEFKRYFLVETLRQAEQSDISPRRTAISLLADEVRAVCGACPTKACRRPGSNKAQPCGLGHVLDWCRRPDSNW